MGGQPRSCRGRGRLAGAAAAVLSLGLGRRAGAEATGGGKQGCFGFGLLTYERCCFPTPQPHCFDSYFTPEECCRDRPAPEGELKGHRAMRILREELFTDVDPYAFLDSYCGSPYHPQDHYPDSHLTPDLIRKVVDWVGEEPRLWLEVGSFLGSSAITTARTLKGFGMSTGIICIDPFTGVLDMWANRKGLRQALNLQAALRADYVVDGPLLMDEWGHSRIYERFLSNVRHTGHADVVMPIRLSSISGMRLLKQLKDDGRMEELPQVIYLDSAHEEGETLLEVRVAWDMLEAPGVLFGDDWSWPGVKHDLVVFANQLKNPWFTEEELHKFDTATCTAIQPAPGLAVIDEDDGAWMLFKAR